MNYVCPKCGSNNVLVGAVVLECFACGWHYLNKHPCRVCGQPSRSSAGGGVLGKMVMLYGCKDHPITDVEMRPIWAEFAEGFKR